MEINLCIELFLLCIYGISGNVALPENIKDVIEYDKSKDVYGQSVVAPQKENTTISAHTQALSNLQEILTPFELRRCLIVITSFRAVDVPGLTTPTIRRNLKPRNADNAKIAGWYNDHFKTDSKSRNCTSSKYFNTKTKNGGKYRRHCTELSIPLFATASTPWFCEVEINLFLPAESLMVPSYVGSKGLYYPGALEYYARAPLKAKALIFIDEYSSHHHYTERNVCQTIVFGRRSKDPVVGSWNRELPSNFMLAFINKSANTKGFSTLLTVHLYEFCNWIKESPIKNLSTGLKTLDLILQKRVPKHLFEIQMDRYGRRPYNFATVMLTCLKSDILKLFTSTEGKRMHWRRIAKVQAYLVETILKNFTLKQFWPFAFCEFGQGKLIPRNASDSMTNIRIAFYDKSHASTSMPPDCLFYFNDTSRAVRFLTTETRGESLLPFEELVNVFQPSVWTVSFTCLLCTGIFMNNVLSCRISGGLYLLLLSVTKCLLEQGDPFTSQVCANRRVKLIVAGIFAACILLSNAYKNSNIYNMVKPRKILLYETLDQINLNNFRVYTRLKMVDHLLNVTDGSDFLQRKYGTILCDWSIIDYNKYYYSLSEGVKFLVAIESFSLKEHSPNVFKQAVPQEKLLSFIWWNAENHTKFPKKIHKSEFKAFSTKLNEIVIQKAENNLFEELMNSEKVAVILPTLDGLIIRNRLRSNGKNAHFGKETYASGISSFILNGNLHLPMLRRIWGLTESGINNWLHKLFDPTIFLQDHQYERATPASIKGNILVIFVVWLSCIILSFITFLGESG